MAPTSAWSLTYRYQRGALGIAHAIGLARRFAGDDPIAIVLGDNILHGSLRAFADEFVASDAEAGRGPQAGARPAIASASPSSRPDGRVVGFEEKPEHPKSDLIPIGVYLFRPSCLRVLHGAQAIGTRRVRDHRPS